MKNNWVQSANNFFLREVSNNVEGLKPAVYKLNMNPQTTELYLTEVQSQFEFPYKIYGLETEFIARTLKTYANTTGNLGLLMNGVKGTGKTVTSQMICNKLQLPVIIIHERYDGIPSFVNEIQQDVILFFDEYEKLYNNYDHSILTVMDGVLNTTYRRVFLMTTNELYINTNMLQRPSRVRYVKTFGDLPLETIVEVVDDKLVHTQFRDDTIKFISELETITIDIVKAVVEEVNIHEQTPLTFKDVFNVKKIDNVFNVYNVGKEGKTELEFKEVRLNITKWGQQHINWDFEVDGRDQGTVKTVIDVDDLIVETYEYEGPEDKEVRVTKHYRLEPVDKKHKAFYGYAF